MKPNHTPHPLPATKFLLLALTVAFAATGITQAPPTQAASLWDSYMPPELAYADDLRQKVKLPDKVNINRASLNQLEGLPGLDQELALKIIRHRPFENFQEFYRMSGVEKKQLDRIIRQLQPKVIFR
ncbi:MAG TPA: helix-hairpin-helix domain-containing protein [Coleofasciculaceae cyanobacterium]